MDTRHFFIKPVIPSELKKLSEMAFNVWSCWDMEAQRLFHRLDPQLFRNVDHNPVELLHTIKSEQLEEAASDEGFLYELNKVYEKYLNYLRFEGSYTKSGITEKFSHEDKIAYICMEYGLHESIPVYSGGLAVLAGDQLKAASDIGLQMSGFGLRYKSGYFVQHIAPDGKQVEEYRNYSWFMSSLTEVQDKDGQPFFIEIPFKGSTVFAKIWKLDVGRIPLYLLDTDTHQNGPKQRRITHTLYDSDRVLRLEQELVLGRGSVIAMRKMGIEPKIYHLNEGHTAFSILERLLHMTKKQGFTFEEAKTAIRYSTVFTTHTPVIAGNENFDDELIEEYLEKEIEELGMTASEFLSLGKVKKEANFWLPAFALKFSAISNGVSKIHTEVSRQMWQNLYPTLHKKEIPIISITNGAHLQTWLSLQMTEMFNRYVGPDYMHKAEAPELWKKIQAIPDGELWSAHRRRKEQTISFIRRRLTEMMRKRGYCKHKLKDVEAVLNPDYLTIGFARRFAQYKRPGLILSDPERLVSILTNEDRPVQLVFAGKAHPADGIGKGLIKNLIDFINEYPVEKHVVFLEDYDINVARHLVQGVDVWLNNPRKPMEASGTSGMKAGINGVLNLSVLDGWWPEAYNENNGWAINAGEHGETSEISDDAEANQIYEFLENEITGIFYDHREGEIPVEWVRMMKTSIATVARGFNMHRVMREYLYLTYLPQMTASKRLSENEWAELKKLEEYRRKLDKIWPKLYIKDYFTNMRGNLPVSGEKIDIECYVYLDDVDENRLQVESFYSFGDGDGETQISHLQFVEKYSDKVGKFVGDITVKGTGIQEVGVRLVPSDAAFREIYPEYVKWKD